MSRYPVPPFPHPPRNSSAPIIIAILAAVLCATAGLGAIVWKVYEKQEALNREHAGQQAIVKVFDQRKTAFDAFNERLKQQEPIDQNCDRVTADLRGISLEACPTDFQEKFVALLKAWDQVAQEAKNETGLRGVLRAVAGIRTLDPKPISDGLKGVDQAVLTYQAADLDLSQCARNHGLTVTIPTVDQPH